MTNRISMQIHLNKMGRLNVRSALKQLQWPIHSAGASQLCDAVVSRPLINDAQGFMAPPQGSMVPPPLQYD